jgi:hypothetical protein
MGLALGWSLPRRRGLPLFASCPVATTFAGTIRQPARVTIRPARFLCCALHPCHPQYRTAARGVCSPRRRPRPGRLSAPVPVDVCGARAPACPPLAMLTCGHGTDATRPSRLWDACGLQGAACSASLAACLARARIARSRLHATGESSWLGASPETCADRAVRARAGRAAGQLSPGQTAIGPPPTDRANTVFKFHDFSHFHEERAIAIPIWFALVQIDPEFAGKAKQYRQRLIRTKRTAACSRWAAGGGGAQIAAPCGAAARQAHARLRKARWTQRQGP